jgi:hypothetical protein
MTGRIQCRYDVIVMAGLDPAIHVLLRDGKKTWMRGSSPRMTVQPLPLHRHGMEACDSAIR